MALFVFRDGAGALVEVHIYFMREICQCRSAARITFFLNVGQQSILLGLNHGKKSICSMVSKLEADDSPGLEGLRQCGGGLPLPIKATLERCRRSLKN